jgi:hypothetical protein
MTTSLPTAAHTISRESGGSRNFSDGVVGNNGLNGLDGGTVIYANLTNSTEGSYSQIRPRG